MKAKTLKQLREHLSEVLDGLRDEAISQAKAKNIINGVGKYLNSCALEMQAKQDKRKNPAEKYKWMEDVDE